jgi:hypothetical protein
MQATTIRLCATILFSAAIVAACYQQPDSTGLECYSDDHCYDGNICINEVCQQPGADDGDGSCAEVGEACEVPADCCDFSVSNPLADCVNFPDYGSMCAATCHGDGECQSGCCAPLEGVDYGACAPPEYCE